MLWRRLYSDGWKEITQETMTKRRKMRKTRKTNRKFQRAKKRQSRKRYRDTYTKHVCRISESVLNTCGFLRQQRTSWSIRSKTKVFDYDGNFVL